MITSISEIKPAESNKSDFFSWRLYGFLRKHGLRMSNIYISSWNVFTGHKPITDTGILTTHGTLMIGEKDDTGWFGGLGLRGLCSGPSNGSYQCFAYYGAHHVDEWIDVTESFWNLYMKIGVCAIHRNMAHDWSYISDNERSCKNCQKREVKKIKMEPREFWEAGI